jgi:hypothetical protein
MQLAFLMRENFKLNHIDSRDISLLYVVWYPRPICQRAI